MKIRLGFVTNSSSSSYIIAKHDDCTKEDIKEVFENLREEIYSFIGERIDWYDDVNTSGKLTKYELEEKEKHEKLKQLYEEERKDEAIDFFIDCLIKYIYSFENIKLEPWTIVDTFFTNDSDMYIEDHFLYYYGFRTKNVDKFKFIGTD